MTKDDTVRVIHGSYGRPSMEAEFIGRTFDDFLLRPQHGKVSSRNLVDLTGRLSSHFEISLPVISANMDSVTESLMAKTATGWLESSPIAICPGRMEWTTAGSRSS
jgi:hypothetical protein